MFEWGLEESACLKFRGVYPWEDESKLQHCSQVISQLEEKRGFEFFHKSHDTQYTSQKEF